MEYAVVMKGIVKRFPGVLANDHVDLFVEKGEIHAIVGENGAGKTTLMKQLYGLLKPDEGEIYINGKKVEFSGPRDAIKHGIGMVHQHFMLVDNLTAFENVIIGMEPKKGIVLNRKEAREKVKKLSEEYGLIIDVDMKIEDMPVGLQQRVEIIKTLYRGAEILILDEPTAVLTPQETEELFDVLRRLKKSGKTIIFISHKLNEVMAISDRITVMRQGKVTGNLITSQTTPQEIARLMVGRDVVLTVEKKPKEPGEVLLEVENLWVKDNRGLNAVRGVSFAVRKGEIVGIAGVAGNGQSELVEAITGLRKVEEGRVIFKGENITGYDPKRLRDIGIYHVPEDRLKRGLIVDFPAYFNMILGRHMVEPFVRNGFLNMREIKTFSKQLFERFDIRPRNIELLAGNFSGGNQQKIIVAREMSFSPEFLVVAQPTRGLDVGAIEFIHRTLVSMRDRDVGILLVSMELDEIFSLSDRILVMYEGEIMGEVRPEETTREEVGLMMAGHRLEEIRK
ncbi:ABC transporter ATP-binding protein [Thermotoga sp. KOL6]|uniref:ABC transporter ATP-binding protein n=1 Tax=Thermotoga sp. KOL6 TaxID=126741 RepID=UPI000C773553|nr:ABC transporter ATP-binding protein [Thermotoga sp. KOL6]PLV58700.1 heme ABC transporter ATP-binding protein [Thermotoga sp. KOL6]